MPDSSNSNTSTNTVNTNNSNVSSSSSSSSTSSTSSNKTTINGTSTTTTTTSLSLSSSLTATISTTNANTLNSNNNTKISNLNTSAAVVPQVTEKPTHYTYLKEFRVDQCTLFLQHKCTQHRPYTCFYWHFKNQRRRRPIRKRDGTFNYNPDVYCDKYDEQTGVCANGDDCPYVHRNAGDTEKRYHLRYYKTATCIHETDSKGHCTKNGQHCAFAHGPNDLRPPVYDVRETQGNDLINDRTNNLSSSLEKERLLNEDPKWNDTNYVLINYKTEPCKRPPRLCRQGFACPQYHNARDKRRNPSIFKYRSTPCPNVKQGDDWLEPTVCENGDNCKYCHSRTEQQFHPEIYKSSKCNDMVSTGYCPRGPFCAFAHLDNELKTQRTHSTSESSDYTLENYITPALPNKDAEGGMSNLDINEQTNINRNDLNLNDNQSQLSTNNSINDFNINSNNQSTTTSPSTSNISNLTNKLNDNLLINSNTTQITNNISNINNNNTNNDDFNDSNSNNLVNSNTSVNSNNNSIQITNVYTRPIGSEREDLHNLKNKQKLTPLLDEAPSFTMADNTANSNAPTSTPASAIPIGSSRSLHALQSQTNSNFNQNLLTLSTNVIGSSATTSSPTSNSSNNFLINKATNVQQLAQLQRSTSLITTPSTSTASSQPNTNSSVTSKYASLFSDSVDMFNPTTNPFDFVNNNSFIDKDLNSSDVLSNTLQMQLNQSNQTSSLHHPHHATNLLGSSSLVTQPIQIPNSNINLYGNTNATTNDFSNYVNVTASPLNPLANSILSQSITKPGSIDSFLPKSSQLSNKPTITNQVASQHNDLLQNHSLYTNSLFFDSFNSTTTQQIPSSAPPSSQSPIHQAHDTNTAVAVALSYEKLKQDLLKEKQNSLKLENTINQYKQIIERFQKESIDWKNKFMNYEHEKSQELQALKKKMETLENTNNLINNNSNTNNNINNLNSNNTSNHNNNSNSINSNLFNSTNNILNIKLYNSNNNNIKTLLPNDIDLSKSSLEILQSLYILFKNDFNKLEKIINDKKQHRQLDN